MARGGKSHRVTYADILRDLQPLNEGRDKRDRITYDSLWVHAQRHYDLDGIAAYWTARIAKELRNAGELAVDLRGDLGERLRAPRLYSVAATMLSGPSFRARSDISHREHPTLACGAILGAFSGQSFSSAHHSGSVRGAGACT